MESIPDGERRELLSVARGYLLLTETKALANIYVPRTELGFLTQEKRSAKSRSAISVGLLL